VDKAADGHDVELDRFGYERDCRIIVVFGVFENVVTGCSGNALVDHEAQFFGKVEKAEGGGSSRHVSRSRRVGHRCGCVREGREGIEGINNSRTAKKTSAVSERKEGHVTGREPIHGIISITFLGRIVVGAFC
jgi:hypothetical protein